jgi:DNA integrity scanning protein DisA with diadenylate cyclase activity
MKIIDKIFYVLSYLVLVGSWFYLLSQAKSLIEHALFGMAIAIYMIFNYKVKNLEEKEK